MELTTISWGYRRRWVGWLSILIASIFVRDYYLQYTNFLSLRNKESVIVNPVIPVYTLRMEKEIKTVPVLSRLPFSLAFWGSLSWLNGWNREIHVINLGMTVRKNREVKIAEVQRKGELVAKRARKTWTL